MKKLELSLIVTCLILAFFLLSAFVLTSCESKYVKPEKYDKQEPEEPTSMFVIVEKTMYYNIVYDKETKVMYAVSSGTHNDGNYTVLVNADGTPKLWEE